MNGSILSSAMRGDAIPEPTPPDAGILKAEVLRAEWQRLEFTRDFKAELHARLLQASYAARNLALNPHDTNKQMLVALVEQSVLEKVINMVNKGKYE